MALEGAPTDPAGPARVDLHCHTRASFDGVAEPEALIIRAAARGLTHVAITDHETLDGAHRAAAAAPAGIQVLIGCEVNTPEGDLIFVFLDRALPLGLSAREAIEAGRDQGALVGIPHPYDPTRRSLLRDPSNERLVALVDWVEAWNGRVGVESVNEQAGALARRSALPAIGVSDAHTLLEVGSVFTKMIGDPSTPAGLMEALRRELRIEGPAGTAATGRSSRPKRTGARRAGATR